jgi:hypothetical protein
MIYYTLHNGDKPFKVDVFANHVVVYKTNNEKNRRTKKALKGRTIRFTRIFVGKNSKKYGTYSQPFTGSAILLEDKKNKYVYIGEKMFSFTTVEPIKQFYATMGNNFVVYPFALTENYVYLLTENVYMARDFGDIDPYEVYYDFQKTWMRKSFPFKRLAP